MRYLTFTQLRELVDLSDIDVDLLAEGFRIAGASRNMLWSNSATLEYDAIKCAKDNGWNPDTTLILYEPPPTAEERAIMDANTAKAIAEDPDWDDIQIGYVDPNQVIASLYPDMTPEELIEIILRPSRAAP